MDPYYKKLTSAFKIKAFEPDDEPPKIQFRVFGIVSNKYFQKCRSYVERLHKSLPNEYSAPDVRGMLDVEWHGLMNKLKRRTAGGKIWAIRREVVVFTNNELLGDDVDLTKFISARFRMHIAKDFEHLGNAKVLEHLKKQFDIGRNFVYFIISIDERVIGSLLFQIYADLVPQISEIFVRRCLKQQRMGGYAGTPIQRIAKPSWIQCGGWKLKHYRVACENYVVPHDRRGVLTMCNNGKHKDNSTQFFITLDATPWMDYRYVAFGQLIQGEEVLQRIESTPTKYEAPIRKIEIAKTGEFSFYPTKDPHEFHLEQFLEEKCSKTLMHKDIIAPHEVKSELRRTKYKWGHYCALSDLRSYMPFLHLPDYLLYKYITEKIEQAGEEEGTMDISYKPPVRIEDSEVYFSFGKCLTKSRRFRHKYDDEEEEEEQTETSTGTSSDTSTYTSSTDTSTNTFNATFEDKVEERKNRTIC